MERMTIRGDHGVYMAPGWDFHIDPDDYELVQKVLDRLATYEDTGLEPEKIYALKDGHCAGCSVPVLTHERQCELAKADREGRCVVLPMPVPCYCFVAIKGGAPAYRCYYPSPASMLCDMERGYSFGSTKEEAEAALNGQKKAEEVQDG